MSGERPRVNPRQYTQLKLHVLGSLQRALCLVKSHLHGSSVELDKEEYGFTHQVGKRPRNQLLFGGALQKMETGSDFDRSHRIAALGTRHRTEAPPFKRSCSREHESEIDGLIDVPATRTVSAALQTIESATRSDPRSVPECSKRGNATPQCQDRSVIRREQRGTIFRNKSGTPSWSAASGHSSTLSTPR
jgi:hypothetical protein